MGIQTKLRVFLIIGFIIVLPVVSQGGSDVEAAKVKKAVAKLRASKRKKTIRCSPFGEGDSYKPADVGAKLKKGMRVFLEPGDYGNLSASFKQDYILVEGKPGAPYKIRLYVSGKRCVVRNVTANELTVKDDTQVIDSKFDKLTVYGSRSNSGKGLIYNCGMSNLRVSGAYSNCPKIRVDNCTIANKGLGLGFSNKSTYAVDIAKNTDLTFRDCVLYSEGPLFSLYEYDKKPKVYLDVRNSYLFSEGPILQGRGRMSKDPKVEYKDINDFGKLFKKVTLALNILKKPVFMKDIVEESTGRVPKNYQLKDEHDTRGVHFDKAWLEAWEMEAIPEDAAADTVFNVLAKAPSVSFDPKKKWFVKYRPPSKTKVTDKTVFLAKGGSGIRLESKKPYLDFAMEFEVKMPKNALREARRFTMYLRRGKMKYIKLEFDNSSVIATIKENSRDIKTKRLNGSFLSSYEWAKVQIKCAKKTLFIKAGNSSADPEGLDIAKITKPGPIIIEAPSKSKASYEMGLRKIELRNLKFIDLK